MVVYTMYNKLYVMFYYVLFIHRNIQQIIFIFNKNHVQLKILILKYNFVINAETYKKYKEEWKYININILHNVIK